MFNAQLFEIALRTRDFSDGGTVTLADGSVVATAVKRGAVAQHLGRSEEDARDRLAQSIVRK